MKGIISFRYLIFFLVPALFIICFIIWWNMEIYVTESVVAEVTPDNIKAAIFKMGPGYNYRVLPDGTLQVDKGDGKWLRLRYERDK